ncbi:hypothetical protein AwDysgo_12980 [Bacteroidales bacterium]|nr:hypothetical protein AwDysgo_12980 [Bacteroidales bacterium]
MIQQYPHYLFAVLGGESTQDENGNWTQASESIELISTCREETNGRGSQIQIAGGTFHIFASLIQLPKGAQGVDVGTMVFISNKPDVSDVRIKGTVLKFDAAQLHSRLWL